MRLSIFNEYDKVLLLGEGNFSFSVALSQYNLNIAIVATCFETLPINDLAVKNIKILEKHGVTVYLGVDATNLSSNADLANKKFNKIIFNFPHVCSKMRLDLNRDLLQKFFLSAERCLEPGGNVLVTLCNGQGGTYLDQPPRRWNDSWKIKEMAAHGNFILKTVEPFFENNFANYSNTGFRGQDKLFFNQQALTHIFKYAGTPDLSNLKALITIDSSVINELSLTDSQTWEQVSNRILILKQQIVLRNYLIRTFYRSSYLLDEDSVAIPLRRRKKKSESNLVYNFVDIKQVRVRGGNGGNGEASFAREWCKEFGGPDGGDGGSGGHVIFEASNVVKDLHHVTTFTQAQNGEKGMNKNCYGKNAENTVIKVPIGTIVRDLDGKILVDLEEEGMMFVAARGGAGGHGNLFFTSDLNQAPKVCEFGGEGEDKQYVLEIKSMAHVGLIGLPNAGKSTLLRAISRARPKVAPYPFTTLRPYLGMVLYDDYEQIAVADLPGLIKDSHKDHGLGIMFLKHAERCAALLFIIDLSEDSPWKQLDILRYEIEQFNPKLNERPSLLIANKIDLPKAQENLKVLQERINLPIIPISAKMGINLAALLKKIRVIYDEELKKKESIQNSAENSY
ncbi:mitochondrial ribosome-associated GTPase 2 [Chelonus insularis]|uniref:mitochondrial ribosome-associated GTPase 2 n=1 Tax=Chelonus insularis TaxID=460826 RepID=UPI00158CE247|nr:mitochondrial ribosome-associated GTPase 2 [Chelonus insularis]